MGGLFGGKKKQKQTSESKSYNKAYDFIKDTYSPMTGMAAQGGNALAALLGGDTSGFDTFKGATGFDAMAEQGSRGITGNAAAGGLLRSGSTGKSLQSFGNNLQNQFIGQYMDRLLQQANLGFQAGNLISGAGQVGTSQSQATSKGKGGIGGALGAGIGAVAASDRRLKKNIFRIGELANGLGLYQYRYINNMGPYIGVMADEVAKIMPKALGPVVNGFQTVNYAIIQGVM